jgi:hypothetical protein
VRILAGIVIVTLGALAGIIGWNYLTGAPSTLHYRLTLKVDVDGQPHIVLASLKRAGATKGTRPAWPAVSRGTSSLRARLL